MEARDNRLSLHNADNAGLFALLGIIYSESLSGKEKKDAVREYETGHPVGKSVMMAVAATSKIDLQKYEEEEGMAVCSFFEELMEEGRMEGREEGRMEGRMEAAERTAVHLIRAGKMPLEEIAEATELSFDKVKDLQNEAMQMA